MPVEEVWGIGRRMQVHLNSIGIKTAWDLASHDAWELRKRFSVIIEKTARELRGTACLELEEAVPAKQEICCSRSFGKRLKTIEPIQEAVTAYATRAAEKLRQQGSLAGEVLVFIRTSPFRPVPQYSRSHVQPLVTPTDDSRRIVGAALEGLKKIHRRGFDYAKAGVMLMDLSSASQVQAKLGFDAAEGQGGAAPGEGWAAQVVIKPLLLVGA
jgi:DNA polymerase V